MLSFFGTKLDTAQAFDDKGKVHVVTRVLVEPMTITQVKSLKKDGYWAYQVAIGKRSDKNLTKPLKNHLKGAKLGKSAPLFIKEISLDKEPELEVGSQITIDSIFKLNDTIKATGTTKGRGFTGVMKRWGFAGGPRTHGQSDRERAPGSIGMRTDPGRVWKGKKMAGHSGNAKKSIRGLQVLKIDLEKNVLTISGTIPGHRNSLISLTKTGQAKRSIKLFTHSKKEEKPKVIKSKTIKPTNKPKKETKKEK